MVLNGDDMSEFLVVTSVGVFIYPLSIIGAQSIEVDPQSSRLVCNNTLGTVCVDRDLVVVVLDVGESSHWVRVAVNVVILVRVKVSLVVFVVEQLPLHHKPTVRVCVELVFVLDLSGYFQVQILKLVSLSSRVSLHFPLIYLGLVDCNESLHSFSVPSHQYNKVSLGLKNEHFVDFS